MVSKGDIAEYIHRSNILEIPWKDLSHDEKDRILFERINAYERRIEERGGKRPKREGYVMERIASMENLRQADIESQKRKGKRTVYINGQPRRVVNRHIRRHNANAEAELRALQMMILTLDFPDPGFIHEWIKTDAGKTRELVKQYFYPWRILQHAIMRVVSPRIFASLIYDTCACIKGKGLHFGVQRVKRKLRRHPELKWMWKTDFKKYYQSIPHGLVADSYARLFKDKAFLRLVETVMLAYDSGAEIERELEDERIRNERHPYWGRVKPDQRQSRRKQD